MLKTFFNGGSGGAGGGLGDRGPGAAEPPGGRAAMAAATATSQKLSHLARPLDHHAQGPNIPFGVNPSFRYTYIYMYRYTFGMNKAQAKMDIWFPV